jgi:hypothetical protein
MVRVPWRAVSISSLFLLSSYPNTLFCKNHDFFDLCSPISINPYRTSKNYASNTHQARAKMICSLEHWPLHRGMSILPSEELAVDNPSSSFVGQALPAFLT